MTLYTSYEAIVVLFGICPRSCRARIAYKRLDVILPGTKEDV